MTSEPWSHTRGRALYRALALVALSGTLFALLPLAAGVAGGGGGYALTQLPILSDWRMPAMRSLILMVTCAPLCILAGFIVGSRLADSRAALGVWSTTLLVPILLGTGVNAFVFKLWITDVGPIAHALENRNQAAVWLSIFVMVAWQYVPCVSFVCWLTCDQIGAERRAFAAAHRLSFCERLNDVYWPQCRNLLIYLFVLISASCAAEYERSALVLRASQGTGTEFFSHWLVKAYFATARVDPSHASQTAFVYAAAFAAVCLVVAGIIALLGDIIVPTVLRTVNIVGAGRSSHAAGHSVLLPLVVLLLLLPFIPTLIRGLPAMVGYGETAGIAVSRCVPSVMPPAFFVGVGCILLSLVARLGWPDKLNTFKTVSLALCLSVAAAGFLPPIALAFSGMWWIAALQRVSVPIVDPVIVLWWLMLSVAALPIFVPGYLASQFAIDSREMAFQYQVRASFLEVLKISFVKRLWPIYVLFGVFVYAFMWSEYSVTALFSGLSTSLCSPILELAVRTEGKGAQFNDAATIILRMSLPLLVCVIGFGALTRARSRSSRASL